VKVLIDTRSLQGAYHFGKLGNLPKDDKYDETKKSIGKRLEKFLSIVEKETGNTPTASKGKVDELRISLLKEFDVLAILTRIYLLSQKEISDIKEFVKKGGNLLLMSNHPPFCEFDNPLAESFGFTFLSLTYPWHRGGYGLTTIKDENLRSHEITRNMKKGIIFNNSCRIKINEDSNMKILATLPEEPEPNNIFAVVINKPFGKQSGNVVGIADSGFTGNDGTKSPGPGLIGKGDNIKFLSNIFRWILKSD
jgi:hypothetical protein